MSDTRIGHSKLARFIRAFAPLILLGWLALTVLTNVAVPPLEKVGEAHTVSMNAKDAPSMMSMEQIGRTFQEFNSDSNAMIVLEGEQPLGADAHHFYDELIEKLEPTPTHVEHIQDFWGDPLTASGAQSNDGKAAYVQVYLHGNMGETLANDSVKAVRNIVDATSAAARASRSTSPAAHRWSPTSTIAGDKSIVIVTFITLVVIVVMLLLVYRSFVTDAADPAAWCSSSWAPPAGSWPSSATTSIIGLSTFATSLLTLMVIAAGTDYAIFLIGRYQEARGDRRGPGSRVLHDVPRHRARRARLRADHRRRDALPQLHPAAVLPDPRRAVRRRHAGRRARRADASGPRWSRRQPLRAASSPSAPSGRAAGAASAPPSCGGPARSWSPPSRSRWSVCSRCPATRPATTTASTCPTTMPANVGLRRWRTGTSTPPG